MTDPRNTLGATALAVALALSTLPLATAGERPLTRDGAHSKNLLIQPYLAPTGATVPKLGEPQTGPQTAQERRAQEQSDKVLKSICSNC